MRSIKFLVLSILCIASFLLLASGVHAAPATFVVTNTNDSGAGSLRQAIEDANGNGNPSDMDVIEFDISGSGVHRISLASALPNIAEPLNIDGYSQTGATPNTVPAPAPLNSIVKIEVEAFDGANSVFQFESGSEGSSLAGLSVFGETQYLVLVAADDVSITGNYIGTDATGNSNPSALFNGVQNGVRVTGASVDVGGALPSARNVITNSASVESAGAVSVEANAAEILGNLIGIGRDGLTDLGSVQGVVLNSQNTVVGGSASGEANVISGARVVQMTVLGTTGAVIQGNMIGTDFAGNVSSGISNGAGISLVFNSMENLIGGVGPGKGNIIRGVGGVGIGIVYIDYPNIPMAFSVERNTILGNTISDIEVWDYFAGNFGTTDLGIDIVRGIGLGGSPGPVEYFEEQGPTANDTDDADTGPNGYINTPVLRTAQQVGNQLTITYDLDVADSPSDTYRVEFFANDDSTVFGAGPAQEFLGADTPVSPGTGQSVTFTVSGDYSDKVLSSTTTAIDGTTSSGFGATSELSQNISVGSEDDFDADGIADAVEDAAPNGGDGNSDGIDDRLQPTVSSYSSADGTTRITFVTDGCSENGTVSSLDVGTLEVNDNGYLYPHGMTDFSLNCSRGDTVDVTMYTYTDTDPSSFLVRKYNPSTNSFRDVPGASLVRETLGSNSVLKLTYSITDGGELDDDGMTNGIIVDPVGLAIESTNGQAGGSLADTGDDVRLVAFLIGMLIVGGGSMLLRLRRRS